MYLKVGKNIDALVFTAVVLIPFTQSPLPATFLFVEM